MYPIRVEPDRDIFVLDAIFSSSYDCAYTSAIVLVYNAEVKELKSYWATGTTSDEKSDAVYAAVSGTTFPMSAAREIFGLARESIAFLSEHTRNL